jgi:hypothetical protein
MPENVELAGSQRLEIERGADQDTIRLVGPEGGLRLTIIVTPAGPVLHVDGAGVMIQTTGVLGIAAERVAIHGREGVSLTSGTDVQVQATGRMDMQARSVGIKAEVGDVEVRANDDVRIDGERIRMNC